MIQNMMPVNNLDSSNSSNQSKLVGGKESTNKFPNFKIMSLNIFSLLPHLDELRVLVDTEKPHIMCINETKLDHSVDDALINIDNYSIIRKDRNKFGGGVALYIHQNIQFEVKHDLMCDELESLSIQIKNGKFKPFILTTIYRPPGKPVSYFSDLESLFGKLESQNGESVIIGDTNCDFDTPLDNDTRHLRNILNSFGYTQLIKDATRTTRSTSTVIDHIITNRPDIVSSCGVRPCGISDHDALFLIRNARAPKLKVPPKVIDVRNYKRFNIDSFQSDIRSIPLEQIKLVSKDANELWLRWKAFFLNILNKHAPITKIKIKGNMVPYITSEVKALIRTRDYLRAKANKTGSVYLRQAFNHIRNKVNVKLSELRKNYYSQKLEENKENLKGTWKVLKQAMGQGTKSLNIDKVIYEGTEYTDDKEIADICNKHFVSIGKRLAEGIPDTGESPTAHIKATNKKFMFRKVTTSEVEKVLTKLINSKAAGIHNIPNKILKDSYEVIAPSLSEIFNCSISTNIFPDDFKIGKVSPAHKSNSRSDLNNYRPISVLPTIARVFERLLYIQMYTYLTEEKLLSQQQFGFRSLHSTALALGKATNQWLMNIDNGKLNSVVFLDIKKAFDTVDHKILLKKLTCYGFKDNSLRLIESYLKDRIQCCYVNGKMSSLEHIICGVPQGSILGPLLFIIYMNDLSEFVPDTDITMFADDTSFAKAFKDVSEIKQCLVPAFSKICRWLNFNKLSLNTVKTEFMIIGTPNNIRNIDRNPESTPYQIVGHNGSRISRVKSVKSLGLIVDDTLTWSDHIDYISGKIKRGVGVMKKTAKYLDENSLLMLYRTIVETHFRYCNVVWGQCNETLKDKLQLLQNRAARILTKTKYENADHLKLLCQLGWLTVRNLIKLDLGIFMYKSQNKLLPETAGEFHVRTEEVHSYQTRSVTTGNVFLPRFALSFTQRSITFSGAKLWNEIPVIIKKVSSLDSFNEKLKAYYLQSQNESQ